MADGVVTLTVKGEGGHVFEMDLPTVPSRREIFDEFVRKGTIVILEGEIPEDVEPEDVDPGEAVERPPKNGSTEAWQAYAISQGADPDEVDGLGRDDLMALYAPAD